MRTTRPSSSAPTRALRPAELLLNALGACLMSGLANIAAARGIDLDEVTATVEGDINLLGILGLDDGVRNGYEAIRVVFHVKGAAEAEKLAALVEQSRRGRPCSTSSRMASPYPSTSPRPDRGRSARLPLTGGPADRRPGLSGPSVAPFALVAPTGSSTTPDPAEQHADGRRDQTAPGGAESASRPRPGLRALHLVDVAMISATVIPTPTSPPRCARRRAHRRRRTVEEQHRPTGRVVPQPAPRRGEPAVTASPRLPADPRRRRPVRSRLRPAPATGEERLDRVQDLVGVAGARSGPPPRAAQPRTGDVLGDVARLATSNSASPMR